MPITPIDLTHGISRVMPVQPVQRSEAAGLRFKLAGAQQTERPKPRRKSAPGRIINVQEDGWIRRYGVLPDGTRILLEEKPAHEGPALALPRGEARIIPASPGRPEHDPEDAMKASGEKLKALLSARPRSDGAGEAL
ncbi:MULTISPECIES: hypothetical protein [Saccharibacillus]|uniref:hypothetical protein n=1 Tax=Saccharibacillus TaxID=456492 RepID=UPI00123ABEA8|nr:hypothetical protein [Saccharibacillus sp. WB 17]MWJ30937.1 hypothetical protein [Saccharibacillus sp. WB 17]